MTGSRDRALPRCCGAHQIDADKLVLHANRGAFRCKTCRRRTVRRTPHNRCLAWRCEGTLEFLSEDPDDYDLRLLDSDYVLLRPREHTAMVPSEQREKIEQLFKGTSDTINALVCTQTLELGVDIGSLDAVLMRNVPPFPANYWQRAGRAGRRHRMAVDLTYCRPTSHDRAYFASPEKMLGGRIDPPSFNLSNELMIGKHVHATVVTALRRLAREGSGIEEVDRREIAETLSAVFPSLIREYLFDAAGNVRSEPLDVRGLHTIITKHGEAIRRVVREAFRQGWPEVDRGVVERERLDAHVLGMTAEMEAILRRL